MKYQRNRTKLVQIIKRDLESTVSKATIKWLEEMILELKNTKEPKAPKKKECECYCHQEKGHTTADNGCVACYQNHTVYYPETDYPTPSKTEEKVKTLNCTKCEGYGTYGTYGTDSFGNPLPCPYCQPTPVRPEIEKNDFESLSQLYKDVQNMKKNIKLWIDWLNESPTTNHKKK